ncbi:hypothetical protein BA062_00755 [Prauserella flavalba]|uniref:Uncharacterized protein n=1 Tax=Prauserella flavalba TaxID=1477506 RepID=A0A318LXX9_9PSEU|nr:hypothetical protein BA062_00755 [Prauserella flavalba]
MAAVAALAVAEGTRTAVTAHHYRADGTNDDPTAATGRVPEVPARAIGLGGPAHGARHRPGAAPVTWAAG